MSAMNEMGSEWVASPTVATTMEPISMTLVQMVIWRLLKRSASQPPGMLKTMKGTENISVTMEMKVSRCSCARFMPTIIESSRLRRMLSL